MAPQTFNFTTGSSPLPDVGLLSYNGCTFSPLFETKVSGKVVKDEANRTTKWMEYTLTADGYVTLPTGAANINPAVRSLARLLTVQGAPLIYRGRGLDLVINTLDVPLGGGGPGKNVLKTLTITSDVAWGPIPELLEFQPLGGGLSAKVQWKVTVRVPEIARGGSGLLQLNYETSMSYGDDGYSSLSIAGTMEVPMTRSGGRRDVEGTADDFRILLQDRIFSGIDLNLFRVTHREFNVTRDKRTLEFRIEAEERPYMDPPEGCMTAYGTYSVRPAKVGMGLASWLCTLKATYTVAIGIPRRRAWFAFLALTKLRMEQGGVGNVPAIKIPQEPPPPRGGAAIANNQPKRNVFLIDFSVEEGLYLDSKTTSFSATWRLVMRFSQILLASGVWKKVKEKNDAGGNLWAASVDNISGVQSWLPNQLDPSLDVIVDFGGPDITKTVIGGPGAPRL